MFSVRTVGIAVCIAAGQGTASQQDGEKTRYKHCSPYSDRRSTVLHQDGARLSISIAVRTATGGAQVLQPNRAGVHTSIATGWSAQQDRVLVGTRVARSYIQ